MIFIDTTHCRLAPDERTNKEVIVIGAVVCVVVALVAFRIGVNHKKKKRGYEQVSIEDVESTSLCPRDQDVQEEEALAQGRRAAGQEQRRRGVR